MTIVRKHKRKLKRGYTKVKQHKRKVRKKQIRLAPKKVAAYASFAAPGLHAYVEPDEQEDIFIVNFPTSDVQKISELVSHEQIHNVLGKELGPPVSSSFDNISTPPIYNAESSMKNPKTFGKIYGTKQKMIQAISKETGDSKSHVDRTLEPYFEDINEKVKKAELKNLI